MNSTTTITTAQIKALRSEAMAANDFAQVALCDLALGSEPGRVTSLDDADWTPEEARAECARVIAAAEAQG